MAKKQSVTKCYLNNCIVCNKLNAKLQKSVTFYTIKSILEKIIIVMNDEKRKIYKYRKKVLLLLPSLPIAFPQKDYQVTLCPRKCYLKCYYCYLLAGAFQEVLP